MRYKMIFGQALYSFFHQGRHDLHIKEIRFLNRDLKGEVSGSTRLLYDEESGTLQRYVNGSAPIASLDDEMVCFLAEVSRCFGRLSGEMSWEDDVWLCVDAEVIPENSRSAHADCQGQPAVDVDFPLAPLPGTGSVPAGIR